MGSTKNARNPDVMDIKCHIVFRSVRSRFLVQVEEPRSIRKPPREVRVRIQRTAIASVLPRSKNMIVKQSTRAASVQESSGKLVVQTPKHASGLRPQRVVALVCENLAVELRCTLLGLKFIPDTNTLAFFTNPDEVAVQSNARMLQMCRLRSRVLGRRWRIGSSMLLVSVPIWQDCHPMILVILTSLIL